MQIRLCFRNEGGFWNAYLAGMESMEGAKLVGCINMHSVESSKEIRDSFIDLMKVVLGEAIKNMTGEAPEWETVIRHSPTKQ